MKKLMLALLGVCSMFVYGQKTKTEKPNVVFIISDQHKLESTGAYGSTLSITPNIDALAKTGVLFNNAYTPAPVCAPARASLITGMYPYANGAIYHKAPVTMPDDTVKNIGSGYLRETGYHEGIVTLADVFKAQNYVTASPGKMHVHGELQKGVDEDHIEGNNMGFDEISLRYYTYFPGGHYEDEVGEDTYMRYRQFKKYKDVYKNGSMYLNEDYKPTLVQNDEDNFDMVVARKSVEFINRRAEDGKNFFLHVGFEKPHAPFTTTQKYLDMHNPKDYQLPSTADDWYKKGKYPWVPNWVHSGFPKTLEKTQNIMAAYNACVTQMDDMLGRVVNALKEKGLYENTIIIYTTDHGEHLFEHGLRGKHNMYEASVNIPFIISYPKLFKEHTINNSLISLIDVMPTLAELINGKIPETTQGISLVEILTKGTELKNRAIFTEFRGGDYLLLPKAENVPSRMMRKSDFKFIYTHGIIDQLYDVAKDPDELNNLIFSDSHKKVYQDMYFQTLAEWRFQKYSPMKVEVNKSQIKLSNTKEFKDINVLFSKTQDYKEAKIIAENISNDSYQMSKRGYYWIIAKPKLTKTTSFYGNTIPVAVNKYSFTLPVSDRIDFN